MTSKQVGKKGYKKRKRTGEGRHNLEPRLASILPGKLSENYEQEKKTLP